MIHDQFTNGAKENNTRFRENTIKEVEKNIIEEASQMLEHNSERQDIALSRALNNLRNIIKLPSLAYPTVKRN